jgi:hypothetical protein
MQRRHSLFVCEKTTMQSAQMMKKSNHTEAMPSAEYSNSRADGGSGGGRARMDWHDEGGGGNKRTRVNDMCDGGATATDDAVLVEAEE